jgi:hypothetical protein
LPFFLQRPPKNTLVVRTDSLFKVLSVFRRICS